jgi:methionine synthase II (cobalamin-independent)
MQWGGLPLCIGSLPHKDPAKAVDLVLANLKHIPFWPQLPAMGFGENMYAQYAFRLPGAMIDGEKRRIAVDLASLDPERFYEAVVSDEVSYFKHPKEQFHGLYELLTRTLPQETVAIKGQVTGPVSLGLQVFDQNGKSVIYDDAYCEIVRRNVNLCARWQESKLREKFGRTIVFIDEPSLSLVGTPFAAISSEQVRTWIDEAVAGLKGGKGLHCCGNTDWSTVLSTEIDILSFDAYDYGHTISLYPSDVTSFLDRGGTIAWGIVPNREETLRQETMGSLLERLNGSIEKLVSKGVPRKSIVESSLITPQCGLEGLDERTSEEAIRMLVALSDEFRRRNGLEST